MKLIKEAWRDLAFIAVNPYSTIVFGFFAISILSFYIFPLISYIPWICILGFVGSLRLCYNWFKEREEKWYSKYKEKNEETAT